MSDARGCEFVGDEPRQLESMTLEALVDVNTLAARYKSTTLWVLTLPEGPLELMETDRGELVLWAYSDFGLLIQSCGLGQPAVRATAMEVADFAAALDRPVRAVVDIWHPDGARYPEPDIFEAEPLEEVDETAWETNPNYENTVVWIPTRPISVGDKAVNVELHQADGRRVLSVFTARENVHAACGPYQAAGAIWTPDIGATAERFDAEIVFDPVLEETSRHTGAVLDWKRHNYFEQKGTET